MHSFLVQLLQNLSSIGVDLTGLAIDHIAYRAESIEEGDELKAEWLTKYSLVVSTQIKGREVCMFESHPPLQYESWEIPCIELMFPKPSRPFGGWDHIEVVLGPYSDKMEDIRERVGERFPQISETATEYSYDEDDFHSFDGKTKNPAVTLRFPDKTAIRFHTVDAREVIAMGK
jgi:predicted metalloenzyme YecM